MPLFQVSFLFENYQPTCFTRLYSSLRGTAFKILMLICVCNARALQKPPPNHASTEAWGILEKRNELQSLTLLHSPVRLHL